MLDRNRAHAQVYGEPGVFWQQDGRWFRFDGSPVDDAPLPARVEAKEPAPAKITNNGWTADDLRRPENKALKAQLDIYGIEWTTAKAAREFLEKGSE